MRSKFSMLFTFLLISYSAVAQRPQKLNSNQIFEKIQKLNFLGSVLYIAAHPDDENTRLISYFSNEKKARTGYLALTRGDGGQNLIGPEIRELLGVIRTEELLAARRIDGGEQFFSRANDFGFSKNPTETFEFWDKKQVLSDVVWAIRKFRPDVIINRFDHRTPGTTHGHHTASAMLSFEAFDLVGDATRFPEQLKYTSTWQPKRLFFNTSSWFYSNKQNFEKDASKLTTFDVGVYYPLKGLSNNEIAAMASSQHLCQGFGRLTTRGTEQEYLEFLKGDPLKEKNDIFSGINTTWNRIQGGGEIGSILYEIENHFDFKNPAKHLPALLNAYNKIKSLKDTYWRELKEKQIKEIIAACAGLYIEASATISSATPNDVVKVNFEAINRSDAKVKLIGIYSEIDQKSIVKNSDLINNKKLTFSEDITLKTNQYSSPYWLDKPATTGMYRVDNQQLRGLPETPRPVKVQFQLLIDGQAITFTKAVVHRYAKSDKGEIYDPFEILPEVTTKLDNKVILFSDNKSQKVQVTVRAGKANSKGVVQLEVPKNWSVTPASVPFAITQKGDIQTVEFTLMPPKNDSEGSIKSIAVIDGKKYDKELIEINYSHIPKQSVLMPSESKVVRLAIQKSGNYIGYIKGAGDVVPESLEQIGYTVVAIDPLTINAENLQKFDAIVVGIRAYNVVESLKFKQKFLLDYVKEGGNLISQYNTFTSSLKVGAPYALQISRDRVTDETAKVTFLDKSNSLLNFPNKITESDFNSWVQERGLYFPSSWASEFTPVLSMHDKGESPKNGSLLVAKYGKGYYIYTGLSFFRELPAGVVGAYKLFANMLSIGKENIKKQVEIQE